MCRHKASVSNLSVCENYKYWVKGGETIGEPTRQELPDDFIYVKLNGAESLLNDRDTAVIYYENRTCKIKKRKHKK